MTTIADDPRWEILDPAAGPADPDAYLRAAVRWHFGEETGSSFWLRRARDLDFDPLTAVRTYDDLARFPDVAGELRGVPVEDLIPRGYGPRPPAPWVLESSGVAGRPERVVLMPDWISGAADRMLAGPQFAGRLPGNILVVAPSGPHPPGCLYDQVAERQNTTRFSVDMDPRLVNKLIRTGRNDEARAYLDHVLGQAEHVLASQRVGLLVITTPLLRACARHQRLAALINDRVGLVFWGGGHLTVDERFELEHELFPDVRLLGWYGGRTMPESAVERAGTSPDEDITYDPYDPVVTFRVVDPDSGEAVGYGQRGRLTAAHVGKGLFLPNVIEADTVIRVPGRAGQVGDSIAAPDPVDVSEDAAALEGFTIEGIY